MKSAYFRELQRYSKQEIADKLKTDIETTVKLLRRLKSCGVVKAVSPRAEDSAQLEYSLQDEVCSDVEITLSNQRFVFSYVGIVAVDDFVFKCYPKYLAERAEPLDALKQVLQVIRKYNSKAHIVSMSNGLDEKSPFNMLAVMLYMFNDYYESGLYSNQRSVLEVNGDGEIDWDTTIDESFAFIVKNRPVYTYMYTRNTVDDTNSVIKRIHAAVLSQCFRMMKDDGLNDIFGIEDLCLTDETLDSIGNSEYLLYLLSQELNIQYSTRKQILLKTLYAFISQRSVAQQGYGLSMYGTNSFHVVWENVCSTVLGNHLHYKLKDLPIPLAQPYHKMREQTLLELIESPTWVACIENKEYPHTVSDTLIPDLITIFNMNGSSFFGIFDAKYYAIVLDDQKVSGHPGIGDITKQYLYQRAYAQYIKDHKIDKVINVFLCPSAGITTEMLGEVRLDMLSSLGLQNIQVWKLSASNMYKAYLSDEIIEIKALYST